MRRVAPFILMLGLLGLDHDAPPATAPATAPAAQQAPRVSFVPLDVFIDPRGKPLACYEVEIVATGGDVKLVGIEGGENSFNAAPYYDRKAQQHGNRVIIGAYSLDPALPTARIRVATPSFYVTGPVEPHFQAILRVAASSDEKSIPATVSVAKAAQRQVGRAQTNGILRGIQ